MPPAVGRLAKAAQAKREPSPPPSRAQLRVRHREQRRAKRAHRNGTEQRGARKEALLCGAWQVRNQDGVVVLPSLGGPRRLEPQRSVGGRDDDRQRRTGGRAQVAAHEVLWP